MIYLELNNWIAESESWQAYQDYKVREPATLQKFFYNRSVDFYIALISQLQDALEENYEEETELTKADLLSIAKGLEIYSLEGKRNHFEGIAYQRNLLYVAALYYLADFPATSVLLLRQYSETSFHGKLERFLYFVLSRKYNRSLSKENIYFDHLFKYLRDGQVEQLTMLSEKLEGILRSDETDSRQFILATIAKNVVKKFSNNNIWVDLIPFGEISVWLPYVRYSLGKTSQVWSFFPSQKTAIQKGLLTFTHAFSLQTPTSSGKSSISELVIYNELAKRPDVKILYLAPFRALASELKQSLGRNLTSRLNMKVKTMYGGNVVTEADFVSIADASVLISTPEKFMAIETIEPGLLDQFSLVICDEGHLIDSSSRGISYELLLSRLKRSTANPKRFLFLSAIVPNINDINIWLGGNADDVASSNYRPTEIELALLTKVSPRKYDLQVNPGADVPKRYLIEGFLSQGDFEGSNGVFTPTTFAAKSAAAGLKSLNSGAVAIFSSNKGQRDGTKGICQQVLGLLEFGFPKPYKFSNAIAVEEIVEYFTLIFGPSYLLSRCAANGFLFHHGDLPQFVREVIESYVRAEQIKLLVCTSTLAEGVNLPIKTLIVCSTNQFNGSTSQKISNRDLKNLIGRAGRAGKETKGLVITVNPKDFSLFQSVLANENMQPANGFLATVIRVINNYLVQTGARLTNELLDQLKQSDLIDEAIIHLLAEDIEIDKLERDIELLVKNTFTYSQSGETAKRLLESVFTLRSEKIRDAVESGKIYSVRATGIPLRQYDAFAEKIKFDPLFLGEVVDPLDDRWLKYLLDVYFDLELISKSIPESYTRDILEGAIKYWINGAWYPEISSLLENDIDNVLIFMKFLGFEFQRRTSMIINYIHQKRDENDMETSMVVLEWNNYLTHGIRTPTQDKLVQIGLHDRVLIWTIANWLDKNHPSSNSIELIRNTIITYSVQLLENIGSIIPEISRQNLTPFLRGNA